jgi:pyruvate-formate lyase
LPQPNLSVRYHRDVGDDLMAECLRVIEKGFGMPAFMNDEIIVPALMQLGVQPWDALDYSAIGCVEVAVPGRWGYRCTGMSFLNLMRVFLAALKDDYEGPSGERLRQLIINLAPETQDDIIGRTEHTLSI